MIQYFSICNFRLSNVYVALWSEDISPQLAEKVQPTHPQACLQANGGKYCSGPEKWCVVKCNRFVNSTYIMGKGCRHYASIGLVLGCLQLSPTFFRLQVVIDINNCACPQWLQFLGFIPRIWHLISIWTRLEMDSFDYGTWYEKSPTTVLIRTLCSPDWLIEKGRTFT